MGVEVQVEGLTKTFGSQNIWSDVTLTLPPGEISVLLGPSGTGKSVFLKSLVGLLKPERGSIVINDVDIVKASEHKLYETRKLFGVLFRRFRPDAGVATSAKTSREFIAYANAVRRLGEQQSLRIGVYGDKLDTHHIGLNHAVDRITASSSYTDTTDLGKALNLMISHW